MPPATKTKSKPTRKSRPSKIWRWTHIQLSLFLLSIGFLLTTTIVVSLYLLVALNIPSIKSMASYQPAATSLIFDNQGNTIGRSFAENRYLVSLEEMPKLLTKAFVAAEDARYFQHSGVDGWSILRALLHNIKAGSRGQGGSTITQQVARSLLLTPEKTYIRKIKEAILAYRIDKFLTKKDILNIYLNQIYLGENSYGVGAAAMTYFGKPVSTLNLAEVSILAGLPQAPSRYSPFKNFNKAKRRQAYVLNRMAEDGYITPTAARKAYKQKLLWHSEREYPESAGYFVQYVKNYIRNKYGEKSLNTGGLKIYTTLDLSLQKTAAKSVRQGIVQWGIRQQSAMTSHPQAALVCIDVKSGHILALTGGGNFKTSQFDRATQAKRQPGSAFKPIVYAAALIQGFTPNTMIKDEPMEFVDTEGVWRPRNFSGEFYGSTTMRNGLVYSRNIVTIKILQEVGISNTIKLAKAMGIASQLTPNLSMALGSSELSLLELTSAYTVFARGGQFRPALFIKKIVDRNGQILENNNPSPQTVMDETVAYQMTSMLKGVINKGTGRNARGIAYAAGKTGTTDHNMDAWFIGFTPVLATGVWMGHDQHKSLGSHETGGKAAAPIWLSFMKSAKSYLPTNDFPVPAGITFIPVDRETGDFKYIDTNNALWEAFNKDNLPAWKNRKTR